MLNTDPARRDVDDLLDEAGAQWRARQVFEPVTLVPRVKGSGTVLTELLGAVGLAAVVAVAGAAIAFAPLRLDGTGAEATPSNRPGASPPTMSAGLPTLSPVAEEAALLRVVEAVNTDSSNFGVPYLDDDGTLVVQYFSEDARAAVEAQVTPGLAVRWEKVDYSRSELQRIASEIVDLKLRGVFGVSSGTSRNRVIVYVAPGGPIDEVRRAVAAYGAAVIVEVSSDVPVVLPAFPTAHP